MVTIAENLQNDAVSIFLVIIFVAALFAAVPLFMRGVYVAAIGVVVLAFVMMAIVSARSDIQDTVETDVNNYVPGGG